MENEIAGIEVSQEIIERSRKRERLFELLLLLFDDIIWGLETEGSGRGAKNGTFISLNFSA